jgi:hypothetical protein
MSERQWSTCIECGWTGLVEMDVVGCPSCGHMGSINMAVSDERIPKMSRIAAKIKQSGWRKDES